MDNLRQDGGKSAEGLSALLSDALKTVNVDLVKNMYVREVQSNGFEAPFASRAGLDSSRLCSA